MQKSHNPGAVQTHLIRIQEEEKEKFDSFNGRLARLRAAAGVSLSLLAAAWWPRTAGGGQGHPLDVWRPASGPGCVTV